MCIGFCFMNEYKLRIKNKILNKDLMKSFCIFNKTAF